MILNISPNLVEEIKDSKEHSQIKMNTPTSSSSNNKGSDKSRSEASKFRNSLRSRTSIFAEHVNKENKKKFDKADKQVPKSGQTGEKEKGGGGDKSSRKK